METVAGDLCGRPEKIIPGEPVGRPERLMLSRPGVMVETGGLVVSLVGAPKLVKGQTTTMQIVVQNPMATPGVLRYRYDLNEDVEGENFEFFGKASVTNPEAASLQEAQETTPFFTLPVAAGASAAITVEVTPTKEYFFNETKSYLVLHVLDEVGAELGAFTLSARVEPAPGSDGALSCGDSTFPKTFENGNGGGPFGSFNKGYTTSVCCDGVFYPMAECCESADCAPAHGCVDGFCVAKQSGPIRFAGTKTVLVGYGLNATDVCTVVDPVPPDVLDYYARVDRFWNAMAGVTMGASDAEDFIHFEVSQVVMLPAAMRNAVTADTDITSLMAQYCPGLDLAAYDLVALDNNVSAQWATGFAFPGTNLAIYSHVGLNISTAVHEIGHLYGCRDFYLDLSGSLQWFDTLYGDGRFERINAALDAEDPDAMLTILDDKVLNGCRGFLGWADSDENGLYDVDEL
jgi:hypothetical protein